MREDVIDYRSQESPFDQAQGQRLAQDKGIQQKGRAVFA